MKAKYTKFVDEKGDFFYTIVLPDGKVFEEIPKELGDYLHQQEQKNGSIKSELYTKDDMISFGRECRSPRNTNVKDSTLFVEWKVLNK